VSTVSYPIDWRVPYPDNCTRNTLRKHLRELAGHWPGWENFPWYLTRTLHRHVDGPPGDWDHLHTRFWMTGLAATIMLKGKFENRNDVLDLLVQREVQFPGILRHLVVDQVRWCLIFRKLDRLPDCARWVTDRDDHDDGLGAKRQSFQDGVDLAISEFIRVLNFAAAVDDKAERIAGHPLRVWFRGAHLPEVVDVKVKVGEEQKRLFLRPHPKTAARFLSRRQPVPRIEVTPDAREELSSDVGDQRSEDGHDNAQSAQEMDADEIARRTAIAAVAMATRLDCEDEHLGPPTHAKVLGMFVRDEMSIRAIARNCGCSVGTVTNRKKKLEKRLGMPLESFRVDAAMLEKAELAMTDSRAKKIYRRTAME
jgi:hypothetical protein